MLKNKALKQIITYLLSEHSYLRDDDRKLIANVWKIELEGTYDMISNLSGEFVLKAYAEGRISNSESIRRHRQKLQELHPNLRGEKYNRRHKELEPQIRGEVLAY